MTTKNLSESNATTPVAEGDTYKVTLITPGQGSSGYYSEEMLREFGPTAFPAGTHSYMNHLAEGEFRSPDKLLGVLTEDAYYEDGVGVVARMKPLKHFREFVEEVAPHVGMSIYAQGDGREEVMEGKDVFVVEALLPSVQNSVDLVSYAGRGGSLGKVAEALLETAMSTRTESPVVTEKKETNKMATIEEQVESLTSAVTDLVAKHDEQVAESAKREEAVVETADAVKKAIAATLAVESADIPKSYKETLHAAIESGDYDVADRIKVIEDLRKEIIAEGAAATYGTFHVSERATDSTDSATPVVKGW